MATTVNSPFDLAESTQQPSARRVSFASHYVSLLIQALVVLYLVQRFRLENELFLLVLQVSVAGFAVHSLLPRCFRLSFFCFLSISALLYCVGLDQGGWSPTLTATRGAYLLGGGALLISICHLPIRYGYRVALLVLTAAGLALIRTGPFALSAVQSAWPIFAAMFTFRIMIYLYDLDTVKKKPTLQQTFSYFFTFPNLWLYVSPILDFKTFHRSYYNADEIHIYQRGILWIMRGIFHLLLWKIVYYQVYVDPARVTNGTEVAAYLLGNVALYLRLSGQFHIMTGILHLFGFHLPETHRLYFLATSVTDYWRRINIYWKDFMVKLFFYPLYTRLRRYETSTRVVAATLFVFFITWLFHPVQFFWIRGTFPVKATDTVFWALLGVLVSIGAVRELKAAGRKTLGKKTISWMESVTRGGRAAVTFVIITLLWSVWSCDSLTQWADLWRSASIETAGLMLLAMAAVFVGSLWFEGPLAGKLQSLWEGRTERGWAKPWREAVAYCCIPAALMVGSTSGHVTSRLFSAEGQAIAASVFETRPNKSDEEFMVRGYYEDLADTSRFQTLLNDAFRNQPADWVNLEDTPAIRLVNDLRVEELVPSRETIVNGKRIAVNRHGMRDSDYDPANPDNALRIAVLGASHEMGYGVDQGETFSDLLEAKLSSSRAPGSRPIEVLNFAVNHYSPVAQVEVVKRKVLAFRPDAALFFAHREDVHIVMRYFAAALRQGVTLEEYPALERIAARAGIGAKTARFIAERKLIPYWPQMIEWAYGEIGRNFREQGIVPVWVLQEGVYPGKGSDESGRMEKWARQAGFEVWTMEDVFQGADPESLIVAPWDWHPNAEGHRMISEELYRLIESTDLIGRLTARLPERATMPDSDQARPELNNARSPQGPSAGVAR